MHGAGRAAAWRLKLLGGVELCGPAGRVPLEGRIAAALAYVAWCSPTPKAQLAALLWPDTAPAQERCNLRQLLRRLRIACGGEPLLVSVGSQDALVLDEGVDCDLLRLREASLRGRSEDVLELRGQLLEAMDFDELPELARWLEGARLAAEGWFRRLIGLELRRREDAGDLLGAISVAETWLGLEPESEEIAQTLMRLHLVVGNRHAALHVYEQLKARLARELGVTPLAPTAALARRIALSLQREPRGTAHLTAPRTPLQLLRPWLRVGREAEWEQLEDGWGQRRLLCIAGAPGVGKSRLALDFAASHGDFLLLAGHRADPGTPYATVTRGLRQLLHAAPPGSALPGWVCTELSQLLPELAGSRRARRRDVDTLLVRLHAALEEALCALSPRAASVVLDNLQDWDAHSLHFLGSWLASLESLPPHVPGLHALCCVSACVGAATGSFAGPGDPLPTATGDTDWAFLTDVHRVELGPLGAAQVRTLVDSLELAHADAGRGEEAWRLAGGNPALVLEALRDWSRRAGAPGVEDPTRVPLGSEQLAAAARAAVTRVHPQASLVAQVVAVAGAHFDTALASEVLELPELEVVRVLHGLERMGLAWPTVSGVALCSALLEPASATGGRMLRRRCAEVLARKQGLSTPGFPRAWPAALRTEGPLPSS